MMLNQVHATVNIERPNKNCQQIILKDGDTRYDHSTVGRRYPEGNEKL